MRGWLDRWHLRRVAHAVTIRGGQFRCIYMLDHSVFACRRYVLELQYVHGRSCTYGGPEAGPHPYFIAKSLDLLRSIVSRGFVRGKGNRLTFQLQ